MMIVDPQEQNLTESIQALELGELELCLDKLGELDKVMEKMKKSLIYLFIK